MRSPRSGVISMPASGSNADHATKSYPSVPPTASTSRVKHEPARRWPRFIEFDGELVDIDNFTWFLSDEGVNHG